MQEFLIEVDDSGRYRPMERRLRLSKVGPGGKATVEGTLVGITVSPDDLIAVRERSADADGVITVEVSVLDEAQSAEDFLDRITEPIEVTFEKRPKDDPDAEPVAETVAFRIPDPTGRIHWCVAGQEAATTDRPIEVDADGASELVLDVWFDSWDPAERRVAYDRGKVEFTHWTGPELDPRIFGPHPDDLPHLVAGPGNNRERSRWLSRRRLPDQVFAAPLPIESSIRVRAWPRGRIEREPFAIDAHDRMLGEVLVPLILREARIELERTVPAMMPIPADGRPHELEFAVTRAGTTERVRSARLSFELAEEGRRGGSIEPAELTLTEEDRGAARLTYTAPELVYEPGGSFTEELVAFSGSGAGRTEVGSFSLHLSPRITARITAEKPGLTFEPYELAIEAGLAPSEIRGFLELEVENRLHLERRDPVQRFGIQYADVLIATGPNDVKVPREIKSGHEGRYRWTLDELAAGLAQHGPERRILHLDRMTQAPRARLDEDARTVIDLYDDKMHRHASWSLFDGFLTEDLRGHRLLFGEQLAMVEPDQVPKVLSGTALLRAGATFLKSYDLSYREQFGRLAAGLSATFTEGVALYLNCMDFADKAGAAIGGAIGRFSSEGHGLVEGLYGVLNWLLAPLRGLSTWLTSGGEAAGRWALPWLSDSFEFFKGTFGSVIASIEELVKTGRGATVELITELLNTLVNMVGTAVSFLCACLLGFLALVGRSFGALGSWVGAEFSPENLSRLRNMLSHFASRLPGAAGEATGAPAGSFTIGKTVEWLANLLAGWIAKTFGEWAGDPRSFANATASAITETFDVMSFSATWNMKWLRRQVVDLHVPIDAEARIDGFLARARDTNRFQSVVNEAEYQTKTWALTIDLAIMVIEGLTAVGAFIVSGGVMAPAVLAAFSKIETSFAALKTLVLGIAPSVLHGCYGLWLPCAYGAAVGELAEG